MTDPDETADDAGSSEDIRARVVEAATRLIDSGGRDAATTRAVAAAAGVQAPTIYRLFGDKGGLLDEVAEHALATYVAAKSARPPHPDPLRDLRDGWDLHVAFGLSHPGVFAIMSADPQPRSPSPAAAAGRQLLLQRIRRIALAGRLRVSEERAVALLQSMGVGTVLTLLGQPEEQRDLGLAVAAREAVVAAITGEAIALAAPGARGAAAALRTSLDGTGVLTRGERQLLVELLDRIADGEQEGRGK